MAAGEAKNIIEPMILYDNDSQIYVPRIYDSIEYVGFMNFLS
jgi:hypothetical protein